MGHRYKVVRVDPATGEESEVTDPEGLNEAMEAIAASLGVSTAEELTLAIRDCGHGVQAKTAERGDPEPRPIFLPTGLTTVYWRDWRTGRHVEAAEWFFGWGEEGAILAMTGTNWNPKNTLTTQQLQHLLGDTSRVTIDKRVREGRLRKFKKGGRNQFLLEDALKLNRTE